MNRFRDVFGPMPYIAASLVLVGCVAPTNTEVIDNFVFSGDAAPLVTSADAFKGVFDNLGQNESLVVARASDGSGALSQPSPAHVTVVEPVLQSDLDNPKMWLTRCDIDSDGTLDMHCPGLFLALSKQEDTLSSSQYVSFQSWYSVNSNPSVDRDLWGTQQTLNTGESDSSTMPVTLKLLTVNQGNKTFAGALQVFINIPPRVSLGDIRLASKVASRAGAKAATNVGLAILGAATGVYVPMNAADTFLDDYAPVSSDAIFDVSDVDRNRAMISVSYIEIQPQEGITIEYDALYEIVD